MYTRSSIFSNRFLCLIFLYRKTQQPHTSMQIACGSTTINQAIQISHQYQVSSWATADRAQGLWSKPCGFESCCHQHVVFIGKDLMVLDSSPAATNTFQPQARHFTSKVPLFVPFRTAYDGKCKFTPHFLTRVEKQDGDCDTKQSSEITIAFGITIFIVNTIQLQHLFKMSTFVVPDFPTFLTHAQPPFIDHEHFATPIYRS